MMMRWSVLLLLALLGVAAACGDGNDKKNENATATASAATANAPTPGQPTTSQPLAKPTPVPDTGLAMQVVSGTQRFTPTVAEFKALPQTDLDVKGAKQTGILLQDIAAKVPAGRNGIVTIEGLTADGQRVGAVRFPVADIAATTLFMLDSEGHVNFVSTSIPEEQWLKAVTGVTLS